MKKRWGASKPQDQYRWESLLVAPKPEVPIWQTKKVWELEMRTKFIYCISVLNGNWNNESVFPFPPPYFFWHLEKREALGRADIEGIPQWKASFAMETFLFISKIQTSPAGRPFHPSHRTGPSLNVCVCTPPATCSCPLPRSSPTAAFLHLLLPSLPALSLLSPPPLFPHFAVF